MDAARYVRLRDVYHAVCDLEAADRTTKLGELCGDDDALRVEVEALLADEVEGPDPLSDSHIGIGLELIAKAADTGDRRLPRRVGRYRIVGLVGQGGMATVYEAEQDTPQRRVALKVVRAGVASPQTARRFVREAHVLGLLQHRGIAQIHDAGTADMTAPDGTIMPQPYLAMELIRGVHLTRWVNTRNVDVPTRLRLIADLCDAVQHAHQRGVIHRDLKPSNILVTAEGAVKVLDFGVAHLIDPELNTVSLQTDASRIVGTLGYMSPEQVRGDDRGIDTRSDVYALGVLLYEVLTGRLPIDVRGTSIAEAARRVRDDEPERIEAVDARYRGDIATIVGKALEKDVERRYASAGEMGADIRRSLVDEPILARPATTTYLLRKFARRHTALVTGVSIALAALVIGTVISTAGLLAAREQRDLAVRRSTTAEDITLFLEGTISSVDPYLAGTDITVRGMLDRSSELISDTFADRPLVEARLLHLYGQTYLGIGAMDQAEDLMHRAVALRSRHLGIADPLTLESMAGLAEVYRLSLRSEEARELGEHVLALSRTTLGADHPETLLREESHADDLIDIGDIEAAERVLRSVIERAQANDAKHGEVLAFARLDLGRLILEKDGPKPEAEELFVQAAEWFKQEYRESDPTTCFARYWVAEFKAAAGAFDEADALFMEIIEIERAVLGERHPNYAATLLGRARVLVDLERPEEAVALGREALAIREEVFGREHVLVAFAVSQLSKAVARAGDHIEAEDLARRAVDTLLAVGAGPIEVAGAQYEVAMRLIEQDRLDEAERLLVEALAWMRDEKAEDDRLFTMLTEAVADLRLAQGRFDGLEAAVRGVLQAKRDRWGSEHDSVTETMYTLALVLRNGDELQEAERLVRSVIARRRRRLPADHPKIIAATETLADVLEDAGRRAQAEAIRRELGGHPE